MAEKVMKEYFCVFKMSESDRGATVSFQAEHNGQAITKLMSIANVDNSMAFYSVQILEVRGKQTYIPVFTKEPTDKKGKVKLPSATAPVLPELAPPEKIEPIATPETIPPRYIIEEL